MPASKTKFRLPPLSEDQLNPAQRALGPIYLVQLQGAVPGAPLPLGQSLVIAWPQIVGLIAGTILLFSIGYVVFQRQEVRA